MKDGTKRMLWTVALALGVIVGVKELAARTGNSFLTNFANML